MREKMTVSGKLEWMIQSVLIVVLIALISNMMWSVHIIPGASRVINYTGLLRGATQRLVKLEVTKNPDDYLIKYLDDIMDGLKNGGGKYELVSLSDELYQKKLSILSDYWDTLKNEIQATRKKGYQNTNLLDMSEIYYHLADKTVMAAEDYSNKCVKYIRLNEIAIVIDMILLVIILIKESLDTMQLSGKNRELATKAYLDVQTGLANKGKCEELLQNKDKIVIPTACIMFDLNNLKNVNDSLGHAAGDKMITSFASLLRTTISDKHFVGRYGGDEFIVILSNMEEKGVKQILQKMNGAVKTYNIFSKQAAISYASGYALSTALSECTLQTLLDKADYNMYQNKKEMKMNR